MTNTTFASQAFLDLYLADQRPAAPVPALTDSIFAALGWVRDEVDPHLADTVPAPSGPTVPSERGEDLVDVVVPRAPRLPTTGFTWDADGRLQVAHVLPSHDDVELGRIEDQVLVGRWARGGSK